MCLFDISLDCMNPCSAIEMGCYPLLLWGMPEAIGLTLCVHLPLLLGYPRELMRYRRTLARKSMRCGMVYN